MADHTYAHYNGGAWVLGMDMRSPNSLARPVGQ